MAYAVITRCFMDYLPAALQLPIQSNRGELNVNETEYIRYRECICGKRHLNNIPEHQSNRKQKTDKRL